MRQWHMRTTLMISLLGLSLGLTAMCVLVVRIHVQQQIRSGLASDLEHSLITFQNLQTQRNQMLAREAGLLADLPSLKALLASQDPATIQDGSGEFWRVSGSDLFALADAEGRLVAHNGLEAGLGSGQAKAQLQSLEVCLRHPGQARIVALAMDSRPAPGGQKQKPLAPIQIPPRIYEVAAQPVYFGPAVKGSGLGYVLIGYAVDRALAQQVSEAADAEVVFLNHGQVAASTLAAARLPALLAQLSGLATGSSRSHRLRLGDEDYIAASLLLDPGAGSPQGSIHLVVLKSYDRASAFLRGLDFDIVGAGIIVVLLGGILARLIASQVTRPLEALVAGTRALAHGDYSYTLAHGGAAEVSELSRAFEGMRTELRRTQRELLDSERLATIGRMASSVSHDLRHYLAAIYANAEFLSMESTQQHDRQDLLFEVRDAVQGMTDLVESLLLFSQTGQALRPQTESLRALMSRVAAAVRAHPEARHVEILVEAAEPSDAWVDGQKLGRALYNLVLNGCQSARRAGAPAQVRMRLLPGPGIERPANTQLEDGNSICIDIIDTGSGVAEDIRETLFQPFVSAGKQNGTGLGLTLAHHIAQEHGGRVTLSESAPGHTVFRLVLPRRERPAPAVDAHAETPGQAPGERKG